MRHPGEETWKGLFTVPEKKRLVYCESSQESIAVQVSLWIRQDRLNVMMPDSCRFVQTSTQLTPSGVGSAPGHLSSFKRWQ